MAISEWRNHDVRTGRSRNGDCYLLGGLVDTENMTLEITPRYLELLDYRLEDRISGVVKDTVLESFDATASMLAFFTSIRTVELPPEVMRNIAVIETGPFASEYKKRYELLTQQEFEELKADNPNYVIRWANRDELVELKAEFGE